MQIVIDIPAHIYEAIKAMQVICGGGRFSGKTYLQILINSVQNGTPLPKGHGRLIEADKLKLTQHDIHVEAINYRHRCISIENIDEAPTIIEADRGKEAEGEPIPQWRGCMDGCLPFSDGGE